MAAIVNRKMTLKDSWAPSGPSGWAGLIRQSGLIHAWPCDTANTTTSLAKDVVGGKDATLYNCTLNGSGPSSNLNNAVNFARSSSAYGDTGLSVLPTTAFSIVAWVYIASNTGYMRMFSTGDVGSNSKGVSLEYEDGTNHKGIWRIGNGTTNTAVNTETNDVPVGTWVMLTVTFDGTNVRIYTNGSHDPPWPGTIAGPMSLSGNNLLFGNTPGGPNDFLDGKLTGMAMWDVAISATDVSDIFAIA